METKTTEQIKTELIESQQRFLKDAKERIQWLVTKITGGNETLLDVSGIHKGRKDNLDKVWLNVSYCDTIDEEDFKLTLPLVHVYPDGETFDVNDDNENIEVTMEELSRKDIVRILESLEHIYSEVDKKNITVTLSEDGETATIGYVNP